MKIKSLLFLTKLFLQILNFSMWVKNAQERHCFKISRDWFKNSLFTIYSKILQSIQRKFGENFGCFSFVRNCIMFTMILKIYKLLRQWQSCVVSDMALRGTEWTELARCFRTDVFFFSSSGSKLTPWTGIERPGVRGKTTYKQSEKPALWPQAVLSQAKCSLCFQGLHTGFRTLGKQIGISVKS